MTFVAESFIITIASPETIWRFWSKPNEWSAWDPDVESCQMNGEFGDGATAVLKPKGGPSVDITIVNCVALEKFQSIGALPLTSLIFSHNMEAVENGIKITHKVELDGWLSWPFYYILSGNIQKALPNALNNLKALAEKSENKDSLDGDMKA